MQTARNANQPAIEVIEGGAGESLTAHAEALGIRRDKPIDTVLARLHSWALAATSGTNMIRAGEVLYSWDTKPRLQKNGAAIGRVYAQRRGENTRDLGMYKIGARGEVLAIPAEVSHLLPGAAGAGDQADQPDEP